MLLDVIQNIARIAVLSVLKITEYEPHLPKNKKSISR